jgi:VanZ family protein
MPTTEPLAGRLAAVAGRLGFWIPLLICTWLALIPEPPDNPVFRLSDVILHGAAFAYLTFAFVLMGTLRSALSTQTAARGITKTLALQAVVAMLGYGLFLELVQSFIPERSAELKDLLVDLAGIGVGLLLAARFAGWSAALLRTISLGLTRLFGR